MKRKMLVMLMMVTLMSCISSKVQAQEVSAKRAVLYSALVPGLGQLSLNEYPKAVAFLSTDLLIMLSYFRLRNEIDWKENSFKMHAYRYAEVNLNSQDSYYRLINNYISSEVYNAEIELYLRNRYLIYENRPDLYDQYREQFLLTEEEGWEWDSSKDWFRYREIRRDKQRLEIYANFAIGAAVINRLISVIDTALIARRINRESTILSNIELKPDFVRGGGNLTYEFSF